MKNNQCIILSYALDFARRHRSIIEFETTSDFSLAWLQVDLNQFKSVNNSQS